MFAPRAVDRFVGRAADLAALGAHFDSGARLVTVLGTAGMGKTRLALEFAARTADPARARVCLLAAARDEAGFYASLAETLCVSLAAGSARHDPVERLGRALAAFGQRGPAVIVLDNLEQLVDCASGAVARWLAAPDGPRFLATSRERLRVPGEVVHELGPLALGAERRDPAAGDDGAAGDAHAASEAVELFVERTRAFRPGYTPTGEEARRVGELVRRLDGIPLGIELAAARLAVMDARELLARLAAAGLDALGRGARTATARQATMRGALDWSWDLLSDAERRALARCAVFRGGFAVAAAEAVLGDGGDESSALEVLQSLRERSLVRATEDPAGAGLRLGLYEVVREYAAAHLARDAGERAAAERAHAEHYLANGRAAAQRLERTGEPAALEALARERDNVTAVLDRAMAREPFAARDASDALSAALCISPVLAARGHSGLHVELLERVLARTEGHAIAAEISARAHRALGLGLRTRGRLPEARRALERARALAGGGGGGGGGEDGALRGAILADLGVLSHQAREVDAARACYAPALAALTAAGDLRAVGRTLGNIGALAHDVGDFAGAREHYGRALAIFRAVGDARLEGIFSTNVGILEQEQGALGEARVRYEQALALLTAVDDRGLLAITLGNLGLLHHERGEFPQALACHGRALAALRAVGDVRSEGLCLGRLAAVLGSLGRGDEAVAALAQAERILEALGDRVALCAARLARAFVSLGPAGSTPSPAALAEARAVIAAARAKGADGSAPAAEVSDDARILLRILGPAAQPAGAALELTRDARWFRAPGGAWNDLRQFGAVRRILLALAEYHAAAPGQGLAAAALQQAGWPGEKILPDAAANRVYVALATLRKRGLRDALVRHDDGYLLDPALALAWVTDHPAG